MSYKLHRSERMIDLKANQQKCILRFFTPCDEYHLFRLPRMRVPIKFTFSNLLQFKKDRPYLFILQSFTQMSTR